MKRSKGKKGRERGAAREGVMGGGESNPFLKKIGDRGIRPRNSAKKTRYKALLKISKKSWMGRTLAVAKAEKYRQKKKHT